MEVERPRRQSSSDLHTSDVLVLDWLSQSSGVARSSGPWEVSVVRGASDNWPL